MGEQKPSESESLAAEVRALRERVRSLEGELQQFQKIRAVFPFALYVFDLRTGSTQYLNRHIGSLLGYSEDEFAQFGGSVLSELLHPSDQQKLPSLLSRWNEANDGDILLTEYRMRNARGEWRWFQGWDVVLERSAAGVVERILGTTMDVTERKQLEEQFLQAQKMEAVGQLAGGVAHDFNNLLTAILAHSAIARRRLSRNDSNELVGTELQGIERACERAAQLARQLLAFARPQTGRPEAIDPNQTLEELARFLRRSVPESVEFRVELDDNAGLVRIDRTRFMQVVLNLVVNACDAMPTGGLLVLRTIENAVPPSSASPAPAPDTRWVALSVQDNGGGIPQELRSKIFDPFFTTKPAGKGTGLGLSTLYGIVSRCGGCVAVESEVNSGTTFTVYLPEVETNAEPALRGEGAASEKSEVPGGRILLVEDSPTVALVMRQALENAGHRVHWSRDGEDARELLAAAPNDFDVLVTDVVLPKLSGGELAHFARGVSPELRVLFVSGYAPEKTASLAASLPRASMLLKPFLPARLVDEVHRLLVN